MSVERCTKCERSVDMDWNGGEYFNDKFYCEACIGECDTCGDSIQFNEKKCHSCHIKETRS